MAKKKTKTHKRKSKGSANGGKVTPGTLFTNIGLAIGAFLVTNYASKLIKGKDDLSEAGYKVLIPQVAGIASPLVIKGKSKMLVPVAVGSAVAMLLGLIETIPQDAGQKAKLTNMALITGDNPLDMSQGDVLDLSDLTPAQQNLLGRYIMTGASNSDPLAGQNTGNGYVVTGADNSDPLN